MENYNTKTFTEDQFDRLTKSGKAELEKIIMGCGTYRPLDNIKYQQEFQYEPFQEVDRNGKGKRAGAIMISPNTDQNAP